ncbi:MAG: type II toxin-antitoxin system prevent-host-death family antitoxin [Spirochaetes bacterium]|nr:type II toxin-antitoxin system prevent-host-death family antitoxin [Spirochaetota bacterium]
MKTRRRVLNTSDARSSFSQILDSVMEGAEFVITRHGTPVDRIIPHFTGEGLSRLETIKKMDNIRHSVKGRLSIRQYINEGKK